MTGSYAFVVSNDAAFQITLTQFLENNDVGRNILDDVALVGVVEECGGVLFAELLLVGEAAAEEHVDDPNI